MATQLITASYSENLTVSFTNQAWFNGTVIGNYFNKDVRFWLNQRDTAEYVSALADYLNDSNCDFLQQFNKISELDGKSSSSRAKLLKLVKNTGLVKTKTGSMENGGGTWLHPKLAVAFARWLDVRFAIWCDMQIEKILHPAFQQNPEPPTKKALPNGLSREQQDTIKALIKSRAESLPKEQQGKAIITCWSALKTKFGYKKPETYKNIKPEDFNTAISLLAGLPLDGELLEREQHDKITIELKPLSNGEMRRVLITQLADGHTTVWELPKDIRMHTLDEFVNIVQKHYVMINRERIDDITIKQLTELLGYGLIA